MDEELTRAITDKPQSPASEGIPAKRKRPMTRVGTGKGSPLKPRKVHVSNRQQRVRARRGFDMSCFGGEPRERQLANQLLETTVGEPSAASSSVGDDHSQTSPSAPPPSQQPSSPPPAEMENVTDEGPLSLQVRHDSRGRGGVQRFQLLAAMSQDGDTSSIRSDVSDQASDDELGLFAREIEHWKPAEVSIEYALRDMWHEISRTTTPDPSDSAFLKTLVTVQNTSNAVANSIAHLKGYLVEQCHQRQNSSKVYRIFNGNELTHKHLFIS